MNYFIIFPLLLFLPPSQFTNSRTYRATNETKMSSSLLLGNFTTLQEQHQSTQTLSTNPLMSPTLAFRFFDNNDVDTYSEHTSTNPYGRPDTYKTSTATAITNPSKLKKCTCCPYGYHIDLDFIRYCEELAKNGKQPTNKQLERRNKRRQRKSLEVMLGFNDQWLFDLGKQHAMVPKPQDSPFQTVYEVALSFDFFRLFCSFHMFALLLYRCF